MKERTFAILGYGTVGKGVARVWSELENAPLAQGPILVRRAHPQDEFASYMTDDFAAIEADPSVRVVAEVMGGTDAAYEYSRRALLAGKSVVSSNKALVAARGAELCALAKRMGVSYLFEASVGGGIPLLRPLTRCLAANRVDELCGILNGTTNYILSAMKQKGQSYTEALADAQALGYAEADPTADVAGHDAGRKTAILASLAFGGRADYEQMSVSGITAVTPADLELAEALGGALKLLGRASRSGAEVYAFVEPHFVPKEKLLSAVEGVMNACQIRGSAVGEVMLYGPGAGMRPTASAVCADLLAAAEHEGDCMSLSSEPLSLGDPQGLASRWYIRAAAAPETILKAFPAARIVYGGSGEAAFLTESMTAAERDGRGAALGIAATYRVLD